MTRLEGKLCVLTAAGRGIGRATAAHFAAEGGRVIATNVSEQGLAELPGVETAVLDVTDAAGIAELAERVGAVDVLFNCAGHVHDGSILDCDEANWDFSFDMNVKSMYRMIRAFLPAMLSHGGGSIINVSSVASSVTGVSNRFAYTASKGAVLSLTRELAVVHARENIRVNALSPGPLRTEMLMSFLDTHEKRQRRLVHVPMGRFGEADEMASAALFLASDDSSYMTGANLQVDGGLTAAYVTPE